MHPTVLRALRPLAGLFNQQTARTNAAEGTEILRKRRQVQDHVDEYLRRRLPTSETDETGTGERGVHQPGTSRGRGAPSRVRDR